MSTASQTATRADRLAALAAERELDALLVTRLVNVRYLTGYTGSNGITVVGADGLRRFVTDFRYVTQAEEQVHGYERVIGETDLLEQVAPGLPDGPVKLGFDDAQVSVKTHARLRELLPERVELVPAGGLVEQLRLVKDAQEVERIRAAAQLADAALERVLEEGLVGRTERAVALALEHEMQRLGARAASFDTIVAAGGHGALPHATPRDVEIPAGTLVVIDWGAELDGYCSDCTRTYATGTVDQQTRDVYELVLRAQLAGLAAVGPGLSARAADAVARDLIAVGGHGERFGHGLGHGVGMEVHEAPRLSRASTATLAAGNVVTVEPGIYLPGALGVRIEDLVLVTDDGREVLSTLSKELTVIG
ncbi:M24 family metallopeptidase [Conexibacter arvalis]|uniref:Xaa-Pro aminopeptidase n=1 Tax=Conexibacter arvalis TaxID=912552 RepID=A0A840ILL7_9ACTN|nr:Xaa-Pro peptidase family protein [Conexibacter arvalis]MBB4664838.1 Xaa-Pro aminopeptidase [Conexibacter arvalis]